MKGALKPYHITAVSRGVGNNSLVADGCACIDLDEAPLFYLFSGQQPPTLHIISSQCIFHVLLVLRLTVLGSRSATAVDDGVDWHVPSFRQIATTTKKAAWRFMVFPSTLWLATGQHRDMNHAGRSLMNAS